MVKQTGDNSPATTTTRGRGRPTVYSLELATKLCDYLSSGMSLRSACKQKGMPDKAQVFRWLSVSNEALWANDFRDQYTRAKQEAADAMAEEILEIADEKLNTSGDGKITNAAIQRAKLRIDTRKFLMAKMKPKVYGDKLDLTTGGDKIEPSRGMSIEEINAILDRAEQESKEEIAKSE